MASKQELYDAYRGLNPSTSKELPVKLIQLVVKELKSFLFGDSYQKKIKFLSTDSERQSDLDAKLDELKLYDLLNELYDEVLIFGESFIDLSDGKLRHIRTLDVTEVKVDPTDALRLVYLKEQREFYVPSKNNYEKITVEHLLGSANSAQDTSELDILNLPEYRYYLKVGNNEPVEAGDRLPIIRIVNDLDGREAKSAIDSIVFLQLEYCEVRARINLSGKHHKPQLYSLGTSAPAVIGRTNAGRPESIETATGSAEFQTAFRDDAASILHLPISNAAAEAGITPKIGYLQPQDSSYLERQRLIILQDIYNLTGIPVLELQNARSASSSSSLSVLYEPLRRSTLNRASYLISAAASLFEQLGIDITYRVELPNMLPKNLEDKKLQIEAVKNKLISRKRYLIQVEGLSESEADKELEQLDSEKGLNIQYSAALVDSKDAPNEDEGNLFSDKAIDNTNQEENSITLDNTNTNNI